MSSTQMIKFICLPRTRVATSMSTSSSADTVALLLQSLQRICRNLSHLLSALDADVDYFERLLTQITSSLPSTQPVESEDFYERLCDEQLEPKRARVTAL